MPTGQMVPLTNEQKEEIVDAYTQRKATPTELAQMYGFKSPSSIFRILRAFNVTLHRDAQEVIDTLSTPLEPQHVAFKMLDRDDPTVKAAFARVARNSHTVTVDSQDTVISVQQSKATNSSDWEVKFTGSVIVEAETIDQAICEARKLGIVKRIYSVHLKGK